jgi:hypothetical protein
MENLPNDIIMRIIKEADGGIYTHKKKFIPIITEIKMDGVNYRIMLNDQDVDEEDAGGFTEYLWG